MNGKDLLIALGNISHKFYDEAENAAPAAPKKLHLRKAMLMAAVISMTLLLVGCAVVYTLHLQDMSIGQETYIQNFADDGRAIDPTEKTSDIITLYGHSGDPVQQAMKEWYEYLQTYDPDKALIDNVPDHPEIPNQYEYTYSCYTQDMAAKVDEIAQKHGLKLLEEGMTFQAWQGDIFLRESGIGSFVLPDSGAEITRISGMYYAPYNFFMDIDLSTDKLDAKLHGRVTYTRKDYFPSAVFARMDLNEYEQWDDTAPDGTPLLLALNSKGSAYIIAERENAMLVYSFDGNFSTSAYPAADEVLTKAQLESIAQVFDYAIQPQILDRTAVQTQLEEADKAHDAEHTYVPETYRNFGDALKETTFYYDDALQYTLYDITGDGKEELLVGKDGWFDYWYTIHNGEVLYDSYGQAYVCEGDVLELYLSFDGYEDVTYATADLPSTTQSSMDAIVALKKDRQGAWTCAEGDFLHPRDITQEEAQTIQAKYPRKQLKWQPLMDYPLSEGYTLGDYFKEQDAPVSPEQLCSIYAEHLKKAMRDISYSHYRLLDINGDGVEDLLRKGEDDAFIGKTDFYWSAMTYRYGRLLPLPASDFYLCEDGVLEKVSTRYDISPGVEIVGHQFFRLNGMEPELLEFAAYNKSTASWQGDWYGDVPMTEEEVNAITAKYPHVDQGMRPISELIG